jgi:hypothetical protein
MHNLRSCCNSIKNINYFRQNNLVAKQRLISVVASIAVSIFFATLVINWVGFSASFALSLTCGAINYYVMTTLFNKKNIQEIAKTENKPEAMTENKLETITEINTPAPSPGKPIYTGHIALRTNRGGILGEYRDVLLDDELAGWTLQNGEEFPAGREEMLLNFVMFNYSKDFKDLCSNSQLIIPASLFENKNEGDVIVFCYNGQPVSLTINQTELSSEYQANRRDNKLVLPSGNIFAEYFKSTKQNVLREIDQGDFGFNKSLFDDTFIYDHYNQIATPHEGYTLEHNGVLYQFRNSSLQKPSSQTLRKVNLSTATQNFFFENNKLVFYVCGIGDQIDLILNEKFLCAYANSEYAGFAYEYIHILKWKKYFKCSHEEMENRLTKAEFKLETGRFIISFADQKPII